MLLSHLASDFFFFLLGYLFYSSVYISTPNSQSVPPDTLPFLLFTINSFSQSLGLFLICK